MVKVKVTKYTAAGYALRYKGPPFLNSSLDLIHPLSSVLPINTHTHANICTVNKRKNMALTMDTICSTPFLESDDKAKLN